MSIETLARLMFYAWLKEKNKNDICKNEDRETIYRAQGINAWEAAAKEAVKHLQAIH